CPLLLRRSLIATLFPYTTLFRSFWFAPLRAVLFTLIIGYGISTRKIMDVGLFLRRAISYGVLTTYLLALYGAVWWLVAQVTVSRSEEHTSELQSRGHLVCRLLLE